MKTTTLTLLIFVVANAGMAQNTPILGNVKPDNLKVKKLKSIQQKILIETDATSIWNLIYGYGALATWNPLVLDSKLLQAEEVSMGSKRLMTVANGKSSFKVVEQIIDMKRGESYQWEVIEWEGLPLYQMISSLKITPGPKPGQTYLTVTMDYRLKPGFLTSLASGSLKNSLRDILLCYKNYLESNVPNQNIDEIRVKYKEVKTD